MKILIGVDWQLDFMEGGKLAVPGGRKACDNFIKHIKEHGKDYDEIILSRDSHYPGHIGTSRAWSKYDIENNKVSLSYLKKNGLSLKDALVDSSEDHLENVGKYLDKVGAIEIWPEHCVVGTPGQQFPEDLIEAIVENWDPTIREYPYRVVDKGMNISEDQYSMFSEDMDWDVHDIFRDFQCDGNKEKNQIILTGLAKDVCVLNTAKDLAKEIGYYQFMLHVKLLEDCTAAIFPENKDKDLLELMGK